MQPHARRVSISPRPLSFPTVTRRSREAKNPGLCTQLNGAQFLPQVFYRVSNPHSKDRFFNSEGVCPKIHSLLALVPNVRLREQQMLRGLQNSENRGQTRVLLGT